MKVFFIRIRIDDGDEQALLASNSCMFGMSEEANTRLSLIDNGAVELSALGDNITNFFRIHEYIIAQLSVRLSS